MSMGRCSFPKAEIGMRNPITFDRVKFNLRRLHWPKQQHATAILTEMGTFKFSLANSFFSYLVYYNSEDRKNIESPFFSSLSSFLFFHELLPCNILSNIPFPFAHILCIVSLH